MFAYGLGYKESGADFSKSLSQHHFSGKRITASESLITLEIKCYF